MSQSSFHMQNSTKSALIHNERVFDIEHAIDSSAKNDYLTLCDIDTTVDEAKADYQAHQKNHRRMSSRAQLVKEAIVNLNKNHTMQDVQKMTDMLEKKYGYKAMNIAIHRDEGYIDENTKEKHFNYHAHIMLLNYDFTKHRTVRPTRAQLSRIQTDIAKSLGMERGKIGNKVHAKEQGVKPQIPSKRLDSFEYKKAKENESKAVQVQKLTVKQVRAEMELLRRKMAEMKVFSREDYVPLQKLKKELKKDTLEEVYAEFEKLKGKVFSKKYLVDSEPAENAEIVEYLEKEVENRDITIARLEAEKKTLQIEEENRYDEYRKKIDAEYQKKIEKLKNKKPEVREVEKIVEKKIEIPVEVEKKVYIENPETQKELIEARENIEELETTVSTQKEHIEELEKTVEKQKKDIFGFQKTAEKAEKQLSEARETIEGQKATISTLQSEKNAPEADIGESADTDIADEFQKMIEKMKKEKEKDQGYDLSL